MTALQFSCVAFYGFWRSGKEYYLNKDERTSSMQPAVNYFKILFMTLLLGLRSKLFPFFVGFGILSTLLMGGFLFLIPYPNESIELDVHKSLVAGWKSVLFESILSLILFWVVAQ